MTKGRIASVERKLEYFKVVGVPGPDNGLFGEKLAAIEDQLTDDQKEVSYAGRGIRIDAITSTEDGFIRGTAQQLRTDAPTKRKVGMKDSEIIDLEEGYGINEKTHFIYDPATSLICVERNFHGPKIPLIMRAVNKLYKSEIDPKAGASFFQLIQTKKSIERLKKTRNLRSVIVKFADPASVSADADATEYPDALKQFEAPEHTKIEVTIRSVVRGGIAMKTAEFFAKYLRNEQDLPYYDKLIVEAELDETGGDPVFDLVKDQLSDKVTVSCTPGSTSVDSEAIFDTLTDRLTAVAEKYKS